MKKIRTKDMVTIAMLTALAYLIMVIGRIPVVSFLKYDPKDIVIIIGGFLYGPLASFAMSVVISFVEMLTVSETGPFGLLMNIISTCSFACTAALIYKKNRNIKSAIIGLIAGVAVMVPVMLLWNYFITPIYMFIPNTTVAEVRTMVAGMLATTFLPFNLLKGGLNAAASMLIYKPVTMALRKSNLMPLSENRQGGKSKFNLGVILVSSFVVVSCVLWILVLQEII